MHGGAAVLALPDSGEGTAFVLRVEPDHAAPPHFTDDPLRVSYGVRYLRDLLGRYDRAWGPERDVFGKVRPMTMDSTRGKFRVTQYLERYGADEVSSPDPAAAS